MSSSPPEPLPRRAVVGAEALAALAVPARLALLNHLLVAGPRTASECAPVVGESASNCSWHLRALEGRARRARAAAAGGDGADAAVAGDRGRVPPRRRGPDAGRAGRAHGALRADRRPRRRPLSRYLAGQDAVPDTGGGGGRRRLRACAITADELEPPRAPRRADPAVRRPDPQRRARGRRVVQSRCARSSTRTSTRRSRHDPRRRPAPPRRRRGSGSPACCRRPATGCCSSRCRCSCSTSPARRSSRRRCSPSSWCRPSSPRPSPACCRPRSTRGGSCRRSRRSRRSRCCRCSRSAPSASCGSSTRWSWSSPSCRR